MKLLPLVACAAIALTGCASSPSTSMSPDETMDTLHQYHWQLHQATTESGRRINALFARPDKPLTLDFDNGMVHVGNSCNLMNGKVVIDQGTLKTQQMISTMMACMDPAVSNLDKAISSRLEQADQYRLDTDATPPTLTLITPDKETLVFVAQPPQGDQPGSE